MCSWQAQSQLTSDRSWMKKDWIDKYLDYAQIFSYKEELFNNLSALKMKEAS